MKTLAEFFHLLSVQLALFFQDQGNDTFAPQILRKVLLSKSICIHQFLEHLDARGLFDGEMLPFVVRDQDDQQLGGFRFFCRSMCFALQLQKPGDICFVLLG